MRHFEEQRLALECLRIADGNVERARALLAFVTGKEADDAKAKLDAVRAVVREDVRTPQSVAEFVVREASAASARVGHS